MYLSKLKTKQIENLRRSASDGSEYSTVYADLKAGLYTILYRYLKADGRLQYDAIKLNEEGLPAREIPFYVHNDGSLMPFFPERDSAAVGAVAYYLYEKEHALPESELRALYPDYDELNLLSTLSPDELIERSHIREEFLHSVKEIERNSGRSNTPIPLENKIHLVTSIVYSEYGFHGDSEHFYLSLALKDNEGIVYSLSDIRVFLKHYQTGDTIDLRKKKETLSLPLQSGLFPEEEADFLHYLCTPEFTQLSGWTSPYRDELSLPLEQLAQCLRYFEGRSLRFNNVERAVVSSPNQAGVFLDPEGKLHFFPPLQKRANDLAIVGADTLVFIPEGGTEITLYTFPDHSLFSLYSFFLKNGEKSFETVKDLVYQRLVPLLGANLASTSLPEDKDNKKAYLSVALYVDLDGDSALSFHSVYSVNGVEKKKEELQSNLYYTSILSAYEMLLDELGICEEGKLEDETAIVSFLKADLSKLKKIANVYLSERLKGYHFATSSTIALQLSHHLDFLEVRVSCPDYSEEELAAILSAYRKKKRFYLLKDKIILLDDPAWKELAEVSDSAGLDSATLAPKKLPFFEALRLANKKNKHVAFEWDDYLRKALLEIQNFQQFPLVLPEALAKKMRPYQIEAAKWMAVLAKYSLSGILADDMGLGKSLESIAFFAALQPRRPSLIVAPKSVVYNWQREFALWLPETSVVLLSGERAEREKALNLMKENDPTVYVTSYDSLRNDLPLYENKHFALLLIDEGQYIKNASAKKSQAVKGLQSDARFALTGTPIENNLNDLWSLFDFLMSGYLGDSESFQSRYVREEHNEELKALVAPFILRRKKEDVLKELPKKTTAVIALTMNEEERKLYDATVLEAKHMLENGAEGVPVFAILTKLREICVDPSSFFDGVQGISSKFEYLVDALAENIANGHKILVFSAFRKALDHLRYLLDQKGIPSSTINGDTAASLRLEIATDFNAKDDIKVLLISLKAGGTGLNLHGADTVVHLDPWWNFAAEKQASDRAYRIGQKRPVSVYKLVYHDSIEEKVLLLQKKKQELYSAIIQEGEESITHLSIEDLLYLLT